MTIKIIHAKDKPFMIERKILENDFLTWEEKGYMCGHDAGLLEISKIPSHIMKNLIKAGYFYIGKTEKICDLSS